MATGGDTDLTDFTNRTDPLHRHYRSSCNGIGNGEEQIRPIVKSVRFGRGNINIITTVTSQANNGAVNQIVVHAEDFKKGGGSELATGWDGPIDLTIVQPVPPPQPWSLLSPVSPGSSPRTFLDAAHTIVRATADHSGRAVVKGISPLNNLSTFTVQASLGFQGNVIPLGTLVNPIALAPGNQLTFHRITESRHRR